MSAWFGELFRFLFRIVANERSPRQLALAISLGVMIGLIPKLNLIAVAMVFLLFALRINIVAGLLTAFLCSWIGLLIDPVLSDLGRSILTLAPFQSLFARLYEVPFMPWTAFNNTVVMGALFLGGLQFYPTYRCAHRYFATRMGTYQEWRVRPTVSPHEL